MQIGWGKLHGSFSLITFEITGLLCFKKQQEATTKPHIYEQDCEQDEEGQSGEAFGAMLPLIPSSRETFAGVPLVCDCS